MQLKIDCRSCQATEVDPPYPDIAGMVDPDAIPTVILVLGVCLAFAADSGLHRQVLHATLREFTGVTGL